ncbi:MAG: hypothetical protein Q8O84_02270 [Nanoarchaeota archaeon]|nr:hypothetical protein [Nanoarchaeota archaeon]
MNEDIIYPPLLIILGVLLSSAVIITLSRFFNKIIKLFELYPESRGVLNISLKFISWFAGLIVFLIFLRLALRMRGLDFTTKLIEDVIRVSPKYILALFIILCGFYVSRIIRERSKDYSFEFKNRILLVIDFIVHMTFIFTALYSIGVNVLFFLEFYKVILWTIGAIVALIISMTIGIPLGISIYERMKKEKKLRKKSK